MMFKRRIALLAAILLICLPVLLLKPKPHSNENRVETRIKPMTEKMIPKKMAILVISCNRVQALENLLSNLVRYRPSLEYPIIVSQDCDEMQIPELIESRFSEKVEYIKHEKNGTEPMPGKNYIQYSYISNHYKNALKYVFDERKFETVVIVEDDLEVAQDFFSYFNALRSILLDDPTLYCVSAWNHNGLNEFSELFMSMISKSEPVQKVQQIPNCNNSKKRAFRITYISFESTVIANNLGLMKDEKCGIRRNSYGGVVPLFYNNCRVFLIPQSLQQNLENIK